MFTASQGAVTSMSLMSTSRRTLPSAGVVWSKDNSSDTKLLKTRSVEYKMSF